MTTTSAARIGAPLVLLAGLALLAAGTPAVLQAQLVDACDWEAAHPSDPDRVGPGRPSAEVDTARAIKACRAAVERAPEVARFNYQLGRALVYAADRSGDDWRGGLPPLERAADLGHRQSLFVLGLMRKRDGDLCASEPLTRAAADAGLKSARISYVNDSLSGALDDCSPTAGFDTLRTYLEAAREQVSGYYENMLLDALARELDRAVADGGTSP